MRLKKSNYKENILVATTFEKGAEEIIKISSKLNINYFQGETKNVLDRFYKAAIKYQPKYIVRITSDCPLIDPLLIDKIVDFAKANNLDYASNVLVHNYPDGQDVEVIKYKALQIAWIEAKLNSEKEHVTPYIINNSSFYNKKKFRALNYKENFNTKYSTLRMTVDYEIDLDAIKFLINKKGVFCSWEVYADLMLAHLLEFKNQNFKRNENYLNQIFFENESDRTESI